MRRAHAVWLVVGLGNPGPGYAANRHNVGNMVANELASRATASFKSHRANALVAEGRIDGTRFAIAKPLNSSSPDRNIPDIATITVSPEISTERPEVAELSVLRAENPCRHGLHRKTPFAE